VRVRAKSARRRRHPPGTSATAARPALEYTLFDTPLGRCGIAWSDRGLAGVELPERRASATRATLKARFPGARAALAPPPAVRRAMAGIAAVLRGAARGLESVPLDLSGIPPFHRRVYECVRAIHPGTTSSYGEVAKRLGMPGAARAVGQALARNPFAIVVPCHRVLAAGNRIGGFTAPGGAATKRRILAAEGSRKRPGPGV
jgi:methylated-DNA-[protein]-cysteine S-methyltransferase